MTIPDASSSSPVKTGAGSYANPLAIPQEDRVLSAASYLAAIMGFWLIGPVGVYLWYLWTGKRSRFLGFHAIQAILLQVALVPLVVFGVGIAYAALAAVSLLERTSLLPVGIVLFFALLGLAAGFPLISTVWMGMCALRGQPRELPILGRWARQVVNES